MNIQRGFRDKLDKYINPGMDIEVEMSVNGGAVYDFCCFGVDAAGKLSDDRYMVFYNQTQSPGREICYRASGNGANFTVNLNRLPASVNKLVFTVSIDGNGTMGNIVSHILNIKQNGQTVATMPLSGQDFHTEKAIIAIEIYRKDVWRFAAVASGFNGGLGDLLRAYGGEEITPAAAPAQVQPGYGQQTPAPAQPVYGQQTPAPAQPVYGQQTPAQAQPGYGQQPAREEPNRRQAINMGVPRPAAPRQVTPQQGYGQQTGYNQPSGYGQSPQPAPSGYAQPAAPQRVSLEKKLEKDAPQLVSLAKPLKVELEKRNLLDVVARVALVLDMSGSMSGRYRDGTVQEIVNKTLPLAVQFDDDGELDFWYYGSRPKRMPSVNMKNYTSAVPRDWEKLMRSLGYGNTEPLVMKEVVAEYGKSRLPAYVLFITDGGVGSESQIRQILMDASRAPIFWQFVGVGGSSYGILERLDTMSGRYVDNANFFALDDFKKVSNSELYSRLLNEFPQWLQEIRRKGML